MFKHVVSFKLAEDKKGELEEAKRQLLSLDVIPEVKSVEVGVNALPSDRSFEFVLIMDFEDKAAFDAYDVNAIHVPVRDYIHSIIADAVAVDYFTD